MAVQLKNDGLQPLAGRPRLCLLNPAPRLLGHAPLRPLVRRPPTEADTLRLLLPPYTAACGGVHTKSDATGLDVRQGNATYVEDWNRVGGFARGELNLLRWLGGCVLDCGRMLIETNERI